MSITKPELVKYTIPRVGKNNGLLSKFGKEFHLFLIAVFLYFTSLGLIFLICIFYHLWHCDFGIISISSFSRFKFINFVWRLSVSVMHTEHTELCHCYLFSLDCSKPHELLWKMLYFISALLVWKPRCFFCLTPAQREFLEIISPW